MELVSIILIIIFGVIFIATLCSNIAFAYYFEKYELENTFIPSLSRDLNTKLIYSFVERDICEEGEEPLELGTWDGSINKCKCGNDVPTFRNCTDSEKKEGCKTLGNPKNYTKINGKYICVKRGDKTFKQLIESYKLISKDNNCPSDASHFCGVIDMLGRKLCVDKERSECPVTKIEIVQNNVLNEQKYKNYKYVNIGNDYKLFYLNGEEDTEDKQIISIFEISENFPCISPIERFWDDKDPNYRNTLKKCSEINGKTTDERYIRFDKYSTLIKDLYNDNELEDYIIGSGGNTRVYLYGRTLYGINEDYLEEIYDIQDSLNKYAKALNIINIILYVLIGVPITCIGGGAGLASSGGGGNGECILCAGIIILGIAAVVGTLSSIVYFVYDILVFTKSKNLYSIFDNIADNDKIFQVLFDQIKDSYSFNYNISLANLILTCIWTAMLCIGGAAIIYIEKIIIF